MVEQVPAGVRFFAVITYLVMITINVLAVLLPINGISTGKVSELYPNLFTPAGVTFSIWGLIYVLLAGYTLYQLGVGQDEEDYLHIPMLTRISLLFSISSLANAAWIFAWHYYNIPLSMGLMLVILLCLIKISGIIRKNQLKLKEKIFVGLPFSIYFGWITVATIANATVLLVSLGWKGAGVEATAWTVIMLIVGMLLGCAVIINNRDIAYGMVLIWAYFGIWLKHTSLSGFAGHYPMVIYSVLACIALFAAAGAYVIFGPEKGSKGMV